MARLYFLGIGGTLMGSLALLAREQGHRVSGFDGPIYPPMRDQLAAADIEVFEGFAPSQLRPPPDLVVVGNAKLPRGHPAIEHVLERGLAYTSGAQWLGEAVLPGRWVVAASGTHGKTTTASMIAHILEAAGLSPGFLIGGVPNGFAASARLGGGSHFVVEADEYDTSYFDRRSKFVHYRPRTLVVGNLEYDHADIFDNLGQIQAQFHHLVRTVPAQGLVIAPAADANVDEMLNMGCWTPVARFGEGPPGAGDSWRASARSPDGSRFVARLNNVPVGTVAWALIGDHNVRNGLAAIAAARHAGVPPGVATEALATFAGVKRRLERFIHLPRLSVYDDFAHHPTAIAATLRGLRARVGGERVVAVVDPGTHTMSLGTLRDQLARCCGDADEAMWFHGPNIDWAVEELASASPCPATVATDVAALATRIAALPQAHPGRNHVVLMSNGAFGGLRAKLEERLLAAG